MFVFKTLVIVYISLVTGGSDFTPIISFFDVAGQDRVCHQIQITNDQVPEGVEFFKVQLQVSNSDLPPSEMIVWITDNDSKSLVYELTHYLVKVVISKRALQFKSFKL